MKKLIILTAVVMLTAGAMGCRCGHWFRRGALLPVCPPEPACCDPCLSSDPCAASVTTSGCGTISQIAPGPEAYAPAPVN